MRNFYLIILTIVAANFQMSAHVQLDNPKGGENFVPGQPVNIEWTNSIDHGPSNWDLYFSENGGDTWDTIRTDMPKDMLSIIWITPEIFTNSAKIKIVQDNDDGYDYEDSSEIFSISFFTGVEEVPTPAISSYPNPWSTYTTLNYPGTSLSNYRLEIYDSQGRWVESIGHLSGSSLYINRGQRAAGLYYLRLMGEGSIIEAGKWIIR